MLTEPSDRAFSGPCCFLRGLHQCTDAKNRLDGTTIDDDTTASFHRAYADLDNELVVSRGGQQQSSLNRTVFVVTGKKPGSTTMTVRTGYGDVPIDVEVLPTGTK